MDGVILMKYFVLVILILFSSSVLGFSNNKELNEKSFPDNNDQQQQLKKAPDFELKTLAGETIKLSDYKGKVVLLDFWATWCGPCRRGIPDLVEIQNQFNEDLIIIGISLDQQNTLNQLQPFIDYFNINYPVVLWNEKVVKDYGNISAIPTSFIIDQDGEIVNRFVGLMPKEIIVEQINTLLNES